jgi:hypothetical protein
MAHFQAFLKTAALFLVAVALSAAPIVAQATPITIQYTDTINLSLPPISGSSNATFDFLFTYDDSAAPITINPNGYAIYGGVSGSATIGSDNITFSDGEIYVYDDYANSYAFQFIADAGFASFTGTVAGFSVDRIEVVASLPNGFLNSIALPDSAGAWNAYTAINSDTFLFGSCGSFICPGASYFNNPESTPMDVFSTPATVPEPSSFCLLVLGLLTLRYGFRD